MLRAAAQTRPPRAKGDVVNFAGNLVGYGIEGIRNAMISEDLKRISLAATV
jgi:hypothetical protein